MNKLILSIAAACTLFTAVPAFAQAESDAPGRYVASSRGQVYYWVGCDAWRSLEPGNLRWFDSAEQAAAAGYRPSRSRGCAGPVQSSVPGPAESGTCTVQRIIDGDTLVCRERAETIRLLLVDAPEMDQGDFGSRARDFLVSLLPLGTSATVELDLDSRDRYDRLLAYLYTPSGLMVNEALARSGFALVAVYPPNVRHVDQIRAAVVDARRGRRGLWSVDAFDCAPADFRAGRCE